ncbi:MAG: hypothetical protein AAB495_04585 [Patescibacteria group bacterium]
MVVPVGFPNFLLDLVPVSWAFEIFCYFFGSLFLLAAVVVLTGAGIEAVWKRPVPRQFFG